MRVTNRRGADLNWVTQRTLSNNNTIALIKGKLMRQMPDRKGLAEAFERNARKIIARLREGEKVHFECDELPDENGKAFKFYLIGE